MVDREMTAVTNLFEDADGVQYRKLSAAEAVKCEAPQRGVVVSKNRKGEETRRYFFCEKC